MTGCSTSGSDITILIGMNLKTKLTNFRNNPRQSVLNQFEKIAPIVPDKLYLRIKFFLRTGERLHLKHPRTYNEKIQWLKLYGRQPINKVMADKYLVKKYIAERLGENYVIPLLGVWDSPDEIDFDSLPDKFVLKCNHNSGGGMCICTDKAKLDIEKVKAGLREGLKEDYFIISRENAYKGIPRKVIAEAFMEDSTTKDLRDYKFFCFNGEPKVLFVATGREIGEHEVKFDFFDMDYKHLPITNGHPNSNPYPVKPQSFEEMKRLAAQLSEGMAHVRVDFYEVDGKVYFGEFTFSHWSGMTPFEPEEWDVIFGDWIQLPYDK